MSINNNKTKGEYEQRVLNLEEEVANHPKDKSNAECCSKRNNEQIGGISQGQEGDTKKRDIKRRYL